MYKKISRKISIFLAFIMVMSSIMIAMPNMVRAEGANLLVNGDFEKWEGDTPIGWFGSKTTIAKAKVSKVEGEAQSGNTSIRLEEIGASHKRFTAQPISIKGGANYTLTYWVKGKGDIRNSYYTSTITTGSGYATYSSYTVVNSTEWQQVKYTFTNVLDANDVEIIFSVINTKADTHLLLDNVVLVSDHVEVPSTKVAPITATPTPGPVAEGTTVILATATDAAKIHYTIDGQEPTIGSTTYTEPIALTESLTIKALAVKDGMDNSDMATFAYTIKLPVVLEDILTAKNKAKDAEVMVEGLVTGIIGNNAFIQDSTAGIYLYNGATNLPELVVGNKVRVSGVLDEFNALKQIKNVKIEELVSKANPVIPEIITLEKINGDYVGKLVTIKQLEITVVPPAVENNYSIKVTDVTKTMDLRFDTAISPRIPSSNYKVGDKVNVTANIGQFNTNYQLMIRSANDIGVAYEGEDTQAPEIIHTPVKQINIAKDLEIKATVTDDRTVLYVKLYHRVKGTTEYTESYMTKEGNIYSKTILSKDLKLEGIEYYIEASDGKNISTSPAKKEDPYEVVILDTDIIPPVFANAQPKDGAVLDKASTKPTIKVEYSDLSGINIASVQILVDGIDRTKEAIVTATSVEYTPTEDLKLGRHAVVVKVKDTAGNETIKMWFFDIGQKNYSPDGETGTASQWIITASTNFKQPISATGGDFKAESGLSCSNPSINFGSGGANTTGWDNGANTKYWLVKTSTKEMTGLSLTWRTRSSGSGPRDFKVQYSIDNLNWTDIPNPTIKVGNALALSGPEGLFTKSLPSEASNKDTLYLRWLMTSNVSASGGTVGSGGTHQINNIDITGAYLVEENQVNAVTADISGKVTLGTIVTFVSKTTGATIKYSTDGGSSYLTAVDGKVILDTLPVTLYVKAVKDNMEDSRVKTFEFTQAKIDTVKTSHQVGAIPSNAVITLTAVPEDATIHYTLTTKAGADGETSLSDVIYKDPIALSEDMFPVKITARATKDKYLDSDSITFNYTAKKPTGGEKNYFGQLHSHTTNSDGAGTLTEAFAWARDNAKLDFFAVTDHSNSFDKASKDDKAGTYNLGAYNKDNANWQAGVNAAADAARPNQFVSFYGYEMTWSGGPGHMNTFATEGFVSRNNTELNGKTNDSGLRAYYELLKLHPESISQFNHPGTTFGNFSGYAYYDPIIDQRVSLIEVGNGEGAIGSGGYFPSYEEYDMALDKGWHLAPTNNQDNHKAKWGNSNTARTVVYTNDFTKEGIYQAMKDMRVYATEDVNLDIVYTLNNEQLGTILDTVPTTATFKVNAKNIAGTNKVRSISIITNGGVEAHKQTFSTSDATLDYVMNTPKAGYYYIKVVQEDGRIAVTAPVWLGKAEAVGISEVKSSASSPVTTEELTLSTTVFNNESTATTLNSVRYQIKGGQIIGENALNMAVQSSTSTTHTQKFTPTEAKRITIIVTVNMTVNGTVKIFTREIVLNVKDIKKLNFIGIDASHLNEYVAGNYKDSMGNFSDIAMKYGLRTVMLRTSEEFIAATTNPKYQMFVITAPTRRLEPASNHKSYSQTELDAIANFAKQGKTIIVTGWGDFYESYDYVEKGLENHMAGQQNKILKGIGATLRLADDEARDNINNANPSDVTQRSRLYLDDYNDYVSPLLEGILDGQKFSHYGGATLYAINPDDTAALTLPSGVIPIISGHGTTYSEDRDKDGYGFANPTTKVPRYGSSSDVGQGIGKVLLTASETLDHGNGITSQVIVSGGAFMSNFEIKNSALDNPADAYSNENILRNLLSTIENITITPIANVKTAEEGTEFTIEGIATVSVYDGTSENNTGFFDSIYVQDETSGINLFPVANGVKAGQRIRVTGEVSSYQGEMQLAVSSISIIDKTIMPITPTVVSTKDAMAAINTGKLIKTTGKVIKIVAEPTGVINQITIDDGTGAAIVYINAYITPSKSLSFVTTGATISVTGLGSVGENFTSETDFLPRIRVRDRNEIEFVSAKNDNPDKDDRDDKDDVINPPVVVPPTKPEVVDNKIEMTPKLSGSGAYKATLSTKEVNTIIEKVLKDTATNNKGIIEINAIVPADAKSVTVGIPASSIKSIADNNKTSLKIDTGMISMTLDEKTVDAISKAGSKGDVEISVQAVAPATLSAETLIIVGTRPVYDINIMSDGKKISDFDGGKVFVSIPYTLKSNENTDLLVLFYIDSAGELKYVRSSYNEKTKCIEAVLNHFSVYAVAYNKVDFKDVPTSAWYAKAVDFIASRRITLGIGNDNFGPLEKLTREQFLVMMMKAYNITPDAMAIDNFDDVGSNYATLYISTAKRLGIANGLGENKFAPTKQISRQEMFVMAYNALKVIGELPVTKDNLSIKGYNDVVDVADWALPAMTLMIESGLSTGTGNNKLSPLSISDRANMAQIIYNLLK